MLEFESWEKINETRWGRFLINSKIECIVLIKTAYHDEEDTIFKWFFATSYSLRWIEKIYLNKYGDFYYKDSDIEYAKIEINNFIDKISKLKGFI